MHRAHAALISYSVIVIAVNAALACHSGSESAYIHGSVDESIDTTVADELDDTGHAMFADPPPGAPSVLASRNTTERKTSVVQGRAELEVEGRAYMPADYVLVRIRTDGFSQEAWTNASGEFLFDSVPPGTYELQFFGSPKSERAAYRRTITVPDGEELRLPALHIPIDSIRSLSRQ